MTGIRMGSREHLAKQRRRASVHQGFPTTAITFFALLCNTFLWSQVSVEQENSSNSNPKQITTVRVDATHPLKSFDPDVALGTSIDILPQGVVDKIYTPAILKESLSAGWGPITYRQNTELQGAAWHWNPNGTWSDVSRQSGYFTGSTEQGELIRHSAGYPLPHRGNTHGDPNTYWKSNPYLTSKFTGEDDALHQQWVILDLGATEKVDTLRIDWANPYAHYYLVQYWTSEREPLTNATAGAWISFPNGIITNGHGGVETLKLAATPTPARYIRIWMMQSSNTPGAD